MGIILISFAAVWFCSEYGAYMNKRLSECEGFLLFIRHMRTEVACFLKPPRELCRGFRSDALSGAGFLDFLSEGASLEDAYLSCRSRLSLSKGEREIIEDLFSSLGGGYLEDSVKIIDLSEERLERMLTELKGEVPKRKKLAVSLSACTVLGFIILII